MAKNNNIEKQSNAVEVEETTKDVQAPRENRDRGFGDRRRDFNKNQQ